MLEESFGGFEVDDDDDEHEGLPQRGYMAKCTCASELPSAPPLTFPPLAWSCAEASSDGTRNDTTPAQQCRRRSDWDRRWRRRRDGSRVHKVRKGENNEFHVNDKE